MAQSIRRLAALFAAAGVFALFTGLIATGPAHAQPKELPVLNLCTGGEGGMYHTSGNDVALQGKYDFKLKNNTSLGSVDCLDRLAEGTEDGGFVQADAWLMYPKKLDLERAGELFMEDVVLICNKSVNISKITGLTKGVTVAIGTPRSGPGQTWANFVKQDAKLYGPVPTVPYSGARALAKVAEGVEAQCLFDVAGRGNKLMTETLPQYAGSVKLIPTNDSDLAKVLDPRGQPVYNYASIPDSYYKGVERAGWGSFDIIQVRALSVVRVAFADEQPKLYDKFQQATGRAVPAMRKRVGQ